MYLCHYFIINGVFMKLKTEDKILAGALSFLLPGITAVGVYSATILYIVNTASADILQQTIIAESISTTNLVYGICTAAGSLIFLGTLAFAIYRMKDCIDSIDDKYTTQEKFGRVAYCSLPFIGLGSAGIMGLCFRQLDTLQNFYAGSADIISCIYKSNLTELENLAAMESAYIGIGITASLVLVACMIGTLYPILEA
jgi:hypothetical protein